MAIDRGQIDLKEIFQVYCFDGAAGDQIVIEMNALDGTLDPLVACLIRSKPTSRQH
ncbi:MAG: hypothetical protein U0670_13225 [Anaerolineae bacterium]